MARPSTKTFGDHISLTVRPTCDSAAYASGDLIGTKMTFHGAVSGNYGHVTLESVRLVDETGAATAMDVLLFSADLSSDATLTNNSNLILTAADVENLVAAVPFVSSDWHTISTGTVAKFGYINDLNIPFTVDSADIYALLVSKGTPTLLDTDALSVTIVVQRD